MQNSGHRKRASQETNDRECTEDWLSLYETVQYRIESIEENDIDQLLDDAAILFNGDEWTACATIFPVMAVLLTHAQSIQGNPHVEQVSLFILNALTEFGFASELQPVVENMLPLLHAEEEQRSVAIQICSNVVEHCNEFYDVCNERGIVESIIQTMADFDECFAPGCRFLSNFVDKFKNKMTEEQLTFIASSAIQSNRHETLTIVSKLLKIKEMLPFLLGTALNEYLIECMRQPCDAGVLFQILTQLSLLIDIDSTAFETDGFFDCFNVCFSRSSETEKMAGLNLAYFLCPSYSQELIKCGFVSTVLVLLKEASFQLSLACCKFLTLALTEVPSSSIIELVNEQVLDSFTRLLDLQNIKMVNQITETLLTIHSIYPEHFISLYEQCQLLDCLQALSHNEDTDIADVAGSTLAELVK